MRTISEGQAVELLSSQFGVNAPVAFTDVKKLYRRKSKQLHPDVEGGCEESFKALSGAFDALKELYQIGSRLFDANPAQDAASGTSAAAVMPRETADGTPLSELGLGLGPTTNGKECAECDSCGYKVTKEHGTALCNGCEGSGIVPKHFICRSCSGTGRFTQRRSRREVDCLTCQGTGRFKHPELTDWCRKCAGTGRGESDVVVRYYVIKCHACKGAGETEVWNPVIPKGRLTGFTAQPAKQPEKPVAVQKVGKPADKIFGQTESVQVRMERLMSELATKGLGGKV